MRKDSLVAANDRGRIRATHVTAQLHRPLRLRVKVYTDKAHDEFSHVLIYDGDPDKGGRMVASKVVHSEPGRRERLVRVDAAATGQAHALREESSRSSATPNWQTTPTRRGQRRRRHAAAAVGHFDAEHVVAVADGQFVRVTATSRPETTTTGGRRSGWKRSRTMKRTTPALIHRRGVIFVLFS